MDVFEPWTRMRMNISMAYAISIIPEICRHPKVGFPWNTDRGSWKPEMVRPKLKSPLFLPYFGELPNGEFVLRSLLEDENTLRTAVLGRTS